MQMHHALDQVSGQTLESVFQVGGKRVCKRPEGREAVIRQFHHAHHHLRVKNLGVDESSGGCGEQGVVHFASPEEQWRGI
jgi:hypothetical protein